MGNFFSFDGPFNRAGSILADVFVLSLLCLLFSLPIITIGASFTALFYVSTRRIVNKESYLFKDFLKSFKENFKMATVIWLLLVFIAGVLITNIQIIQNFENIGKILVLIYGFLLFELFMLFIYIFPTLARFEMGFKELLKSSFFMANRHLPATALCICIMALLLLLVYLFPPFLLVYAGAYAFLSSGVIMRVFKKYRPDIDEDAERDSEEYF